MRFSLRAGLAREPAFKSQPGAGGAGKGLFGLMGDRGDCGDRGSSGMVTTGGGDVYKEPETMSDRSSLTSRQQMQCAWTPWEPIDHFGTTEPRGCGCGCAASRKVRHSQDERTTSKTSNRVKLKETTGQQEKEENAVEAATKSYDSRCADVGTRISPELS